jgi:hypothetical protein
MADPVSLIGQTRVVKKLEIVWLRVLLRLSV